MTKQEESKEYKNQAGTDNEVGITDEIGIGMLQQQVANLYDEREAFKRGVSEAKKGYDNYKEQADVEEKLQDLQLANFGLVEAHKTHKVHLLPEFWDLQKKKFEYEIKMARMQDKSQLEGYEAEIKKGEERLASVEEQLNKKFKKLNDLKADIPLDPYKQEE